MRKDMSKVIVERPRTGRAAAGMRPGRTRMLADDDGEPIKAKGARVPKRREQKTKNLNETLAPLRRYLESQVGRPWDKVYSEISEHLKPTSTVQQHVRDHLEDFVAIKTRTENGKIWVTRRWGGPMPLERSWMRYYVHPRTGLLRKNDVYKGVRQATLRSRKAAADELAQRMRVIDEMTQLHQFDGAWWEVKLAKVKSHRHRQKNGVVMRFDEPYEDVVLRAKMTTLGPEALYGRAGVFAVAKRQLSKAEMKRLKLR